MKSAIIITASRGLGPELATTSSEYNIQSKTHFVTCQNVGEPSTLKTCHPNYVTDVASNTDSLMDKENFDYVLWYTGVFLQKPFAEMSDAELDILFDLHYRIPLKIIHRLHKQKKSPYHLIVVASCSSWRMRLHEAVYCSLCAAKATFARTFANELSRDLVGSKVTLINPGGLRTPFFYENDLDQAAGYLDSTVLAKFIWQAAIEQTKAFEEIQYLRNKSYPPTHGAPIIELGSRPPEII